jgi:hypothetical protein
MRNLAAMMIVSVLSMSVGCQKKTSSSEKPGNTTLSGIPVRSETALSPLAYEAAKQALELWKPTKIGESYYVYMIQPLYMRGPEVGKTIFELREVEVFVDPGGLSDADRLNGLAWKGSVRLQAKLARCYWDYKYRVRPANTWSVWEEGDNILASAGLYPIKFENKNGKWKIVEGVERTTFKQIDQSDIPK